MADTLDDKRAARAQRFGIPLTVLPRAVVLPSPVVRAPTAGVGIAAPSRSPSTAQPSALSTSPHGSQGSHVAPAAAAAPSPSPFVVDGRRIIKRPRAEGVAADPADASKAVKVTGEQQPHRCVGPAAAAAPQASGPAVSARSTSTSLPSLSTALPRSGAAATAAPPRPQGSTPSGHDSTTQTGGTAVDWLEVFTGPPAAVAIVPLEPLDPLPQRERRRNRGS